MFFRQVKDTNLVTVREKEDVGVNLRFILSHKDWALHVNKSISY